jgi:hypothetical protein
VTFPWIHIFYPGLVHPLYYTTFYHIPLLKIISTGFNVPYSYMCGKHIILFYPLHLPFPSLNALALNMTCFIFLPSLVKYLIIVQWGFCLDFTCKYILLKLVCSPQLLFSLTFSLAVSCLYTDVMYFIIIHSFSSSFPPPSVSSNSLTFRNMFCIY